MASPKCKSWDEFGKGDNAPPKKVVKKRSPPVFHKHSFVRSFMSASNFLELIWTSKDSQPENDALIAFLTSLIDACDSQATSLGLVLAPLRRVSKASSEYVPNAEESLNGTTYWQKYFVRCRSLDECRIGLQHVATKLNELNGKSKEFIVPDDFDRPPNGVIAGLPLDHYMVDSKVKQLFLQIMDLEGHAGWQQWAAAYPESASHFFSAPYTYQAFELFGFRNDSQLYDLAMGRNNGVDVVNPSSNVNGGNESGETKTGGEEEAKDGNHDGELK